MIGTDELEYLVKTALYSSCLKNERPVSLLISARVESGKTEIVTKFRDNHGILFMSDLTAWGIQKHYLKRLTSGDIKYIIIPDILVPLSRSGDTVNSLIGFLNSLIEEGVKEISTYAMHFALPTPVRCGLITTITRDDLLGNRRKRWTSIGFMSRMLPVTYDYHAKTVMDILGSICDHEYYQDASIKLNLPTAPVQVYLDPAFSERMQGIALQLVDAEELYGFRMQKHLQRLMMAHAVMKGRTTVSDEDFKMIKEMTKYINLSYTKV